MTMTTVGYGDISSQNVYEQIINMIMMVLACAAFGFIMNKISTIIHELEERNMQFYRELNIINRYMSKLGIN
jgi:hypothetical protein